MVLNEAQSKEGLSSRSRFRKLALLSGPYDSQIHELQIFFFAAEKGALRASVGELQQRPLGCWSKATPLLLTIIFYLKSSSWIATGPEWTLRLQFTQWQCGLRVLSIANYIVGSAQQHSIVKWPLYIRDQALEISEGKSKSMGKWLRFLLVLFLLLITLMPSWRSFLQLTEGENAWSWCLDGSLRYAGISQK